MQFVYVLQSLKDGDFYVGYTKEINQRLKKHFQGKVPSTKNRRPLKFKYAEICNNTKDAIHREQYLKTAWGKRYLKNRLKNDSKTPLDRAVLI